MDKTKKFLITSALPYANGELHLGHLAGAYLPADIYVRYLRAIGCEVCYICGSDEHGAAITMRAKKEGVSPREIIDKYHALNKETFQRLGISFDYYHRTSEPLHHETSQAFFLKLIEKGGELEERETQQYFDEEFQQFLADRYIMGECPKCGNPEAYGDQCEKCGSSLSPTELKNPRSVLSGKPPVLKPTTHWYFRLDKHAAWLREWIKNGTLDGNQHHDTAAWKKHVTGQCLSWLDEDEGLRPRAITRDLDWGIPVPVPGAQGKVLYVWFDAPIGYISSTRQWASENNQDWESWWKGEDVNLVHFIGKDNIVFHCIVFPAMLKAHGEFALPRNVPANQFLNFEGRKFSKSKSWGIEQHEYLDEFAEFPNKEDALRWALIRNMPENRDADFKWDDFVDFHDKDLADNLGNFVNRVLTLTINWFDGVIPPPPVPEAEQAAGIIPAPRSKGEPQAVWLEEKLMPVIQLTASWVEEVEDFSFKTAAATLMEISSWGNQYLQDAAPWAARKANPDAPIAAESIFVSLQVVALLSLLTEPFIPFTSLKIREMLQLTPVGKGDLKAALENLSNGLPLLPAGHQLGEPAILFPKIHDRKDDSRLKIIERQKEKLSAVLAAEEEANKAAMPQFQPLKPEITYEDFAKLDIRTATILAAERIPKADKLLKLTVDLGLEQRTVVSGIAEHFSPGEVIGKQVLLLANLAPRKLRGVDSQGMILMAENAEGRLGFVNAGEDWGGGWSVK